MSALGWIVLATAFLVLMMVANNSWPFVWAKIRNGFPQAGSGNAIVPTPDQPGDLTIPPDLQPNGPPDGTIVPTPDQPGQLILPPELGG